MQYLHVMLNTISYTISHTISHSAISHGISHWYRMRYRIRYRIMRYLYLSHAISYAILQCDIACDISECDIACDIALDIACNAISHAIKKISHLSRIQMQGWIVKSCRQALAAAAAHLLVQPEVWDATRHTGSLRFVFKLSRLRQTCVWQRESQAASLKFNARSGTLASSPPDWPKLVCSGSLKVTRSLRSRFWRLHPSLMILREKQVCCGGPRAYAGPRRAGPKG